MSIKIKLNNDWVDTNIKAVRGVNHVNSEDVYTKEETEKKFATKTEVQTQINNSITKENIENTIEAWLEEDNESTNGEVYTKQESDALFSGKVSKTDIVQSTGTSTTSVMSQKAVSNIVDTIRDQVNNYKPIVIEGNVTNAADEEDITSENGLLKLKDRSALNGMGYVILRQNKDFAEQVIKANTIYEVRYDFDLNGAEITIPENCTLKFEGGSIYNGSVFFNQTILLNSKFVNCYLTGDIHTREIISDNSFLGDNRYDVSILAFLLKNCIQNNTILDLNRDYSINYEQCVKIPSVGRCFSCAYNNEGFTINGNGHTIHETIMSDIGEFNHFFIYIEKCNNVKVTGLTYRCDYADGYLDSYDKKESSGATIIYTAGDCGNCYFDLCGFRVSTIVRAGAFGNDYERNEDGTIKVDDTGSQVIDGVPTPNHVHRGIHDSKFILKGYHVGYTVAVYTGENLDVISYFNGAHRAIYLTGVNNSKIVAKGKNVRTPVIVMLGESVYYDIEDVNFVHPKFKPCSNIDCDITDTGSRKIKDDDPGYKNWPNNVYTTGLDIRPYGKGANAFHFNKRNYAHHFSNIRCTIRRENITEESTQLTAVVVSGLVKSLGDTCSVEIIDSVLDAVPSIDSSTGEGLKLPFNLIDVSSQVETDGNSIDDKTLVNVKLNRIIAPEANCIMDSPFNADFSACKIKNIIIREYEKKNILRFTDSEFYVISTNAQVSNTVVETTNTSYTDIPVKYVKVDDVNVAQTLAKVEDIDLSNLLKFNQYYVEVSNNKTFLFTNESLKRETKVTILVKNIGQSSIYISLSSASWITTPSNALQVRPQEVVTLNVMNISGTYRVAHIRGEYSNLRAVADGSMPSNGVVDGAEIYNITLRKTAYWSVARGKWLLADGYTMGRREGESSARPSLDRNDTGLIFFDTTLNCPVWWTGTKWVDATGAEV